MLIGHGTKNQFRYLNDLKFILKKIALQIPKDAAFLYFGDTPNKKTPDIGYAFELLYNMRPDIQIYMIQIKEAESWGIPKFVKAVYWHNDYNNKCKWGGIYNNIPCSNTKKWVNINKYVPIAKVFILGGGMITLDEYLLIKKLNIGYEYFEIQRRYLGDGITKVIDSTTLKDSIGITYNKIKNKSI
jgi:hypothetical protein